MIVILRADCSQYLVTAEVGGDYKGEDHIVKRRENFKNFCIFHEDKNIDIFINIILREDNYQNLISLTVISKAGNYGLKWEKI